MTTDPTVVNHDLSLLAPNFASGLKDAIAECANTPFKFNNTILASSLDVMIFEGYRSGERQAWLFAQGRTRSGTIVTNARTNLTSWHGYALAVDVVHRTKFWEPFGSGMIKENRLKNEAWFAAVAAVFKRHNCNWGGDWTKPDTPHMQWHGCTASPSQGAIDLVRAQGIHAVWEKLGASVPQAMPLLAPTPPEGSPAPVFRSLVQNGFFSSDPFNLNVRRSIRTNNPGALNKSGWQEAYPGYAGKTQPDSAGNVTTIYRTPEHGVGAWFHLLCVRYSFGYDGTLSLAQLAMRYAGVANETASVVKTYVAGWVNASAGQLTPASTIRLSDDAQVTVLARSMFRHEAGVASPLHDDQIIFGVTAERNSTLPPQ